MRKKLKLAFDDLSTELLVIETSEELKTIIGGAAVDDLMFLLVSKGFTFTEDGYGGYYGTAPGGSQNEYQFSAHQDYDFGSDWGGWAYVYNGGSGSGEFDLGTSPGTTDCLPLALDALMSGMINPLERGMIPTSFALDAYDHHNGTDSTTTGVDPSDLSSVLDLAADMNGFTAKTRATGDLLNFFETQYEDASEIKIEGVGYYNVPGGGSHAVNVTGYYKNEDGDWYVKYEDKQNGGGLLQKPASEMVGLTTLSPK
ncbi:hypothetical protein [Niabella beijingensis]|uniref:hypothetical protein n=1 Tax=Niabella beijingensis TaxID=2872700 RepID=UPI001CBAE693|nr:hypothetical protein [Niabella beijingensis]MBZ4190587.1 hypothetical protein [Niabella beijingensis]